MARDIVIPTFPMVPQPWHIRYGTLVMARDIVVPTVLTIPQEHPELLEAALEALDTHILCELPLEFHLLHGAHKVF